MESADAIERKWACVAVSNLIQNDPSTRRLLQGKNIVGALISRLTDSEQEVVVEAAGALRCVRLCYSAVKFQICSSLLCGDRNLCIDGGYEICAEMYNKNVLVPLQTFVPKVCHLSVVVGFLLHICAFVRYRLCCPSFWSRPRQRLKMHKKSCTSLQIM